MPTVPAVRFGAAHDVEEEFLELVCADEELLRAEFDAIIAREWPSRRPPPGLAAASPGTGAARQRQLMAHGLRASPGEPRHPCARRWRRQRSPPRHTRGTAPARAREGRAHEGR